MKRILSVLLVLCMLGTYAYAGGKTVEIPYKDSTLTLTFESAEIVDGELKVKVSGFQGVNVANLSNGFPAFVNAELNGGKVYISKIHCGLDGVYEYTLPMEELPETIYIYADGDEANRQVLWDNTELEEILDSVPEFVIEIEDEETAEERESAGEIEEPEYDNAEIKEQIVSNVLEALNTSDYVTAYEALKAGEIIKDGMNSKTAKIVQGVIEAFGKDIHPDGMVGPKTMGFINDIRASFGEESVKEFDADCFRDMLLWLQLTHDPYDADDLFSDMDYDEYMYLSACAMDLRGRGYDAKGFFENTEWKDAEDRAKNCVKEWPKNGEFYRNKDYPGSSMYLTLKVQNRDADIGSQFKLYAKNGDLVSSVFIHGSGSVTSYLPAGTYMLKEGTGTDWYGLENSFGPDGDYDIMTFEDGEQYTLFERGYSYTLTINTSEITGDSVGSDYEYWDEF